MQRVCRHLSITLVVYLILPAAAMAQVVIGPGPGGAPQVHVIEPSGHAHDSDAFRHFSGA